MKLQELWAYLTSWISRFGHSGNSSEERFRQLFERMPEPVWIVTDSHFIEANPAALAAIGYMDRPSFLNLHPGEVSPEYQPDGELSRTKAERMARLGLEKGVHRFEWIHKRCDGTLFPVEVTLTAINWLGKPSIYCTWRDITQQKRAEEALKASELKYASVFQSSPSAIVITRRADGKILDINPAFESMTGYTRLDAMGKTTAELGMWVDSRERERFLASLRENGEIDQQEYRFHKHDRSLFTGLISARAFSLDGEPVLLGSILDISERKQAEAALKASEAHLQLITDNAPVILLEFDKDLRYCFVNRRAGNVFGLSPQSMLGRPVREVVGKQAFEYALPYMRKALAGVPVDFEVELPETLEGSRIMDVHYVPRRDASGEVTGLLAAITDITQRKGYEKELRLLRTIVERNKDVVFVTRPDGSFEYVNEAASRSLEYSRSELMGGLTVSDVDPLYDKPAWDQHWLDLKAAGELNIETLHRSRSGRTYPVEVNITYIEHEGEAFNCGIIRDISERKQRERDLEEARAAASAASQAKSQFLAHMSHEIRTPMNAILGFTQVLAREELIPEHRAMIQHIDQSGRSLLGIINDILDFSKIEAGQLSLDMRPFRLASLLEQVDSLLGGLAREKGLTLRVEAPPMTGLLVGDALRLEQVLINLTGNAIKFTEAGSVVIRVQPINVSEDVAHLHFEVEDTGIGMADETRANLFRPFSQADSSITRRFGGTGLGLSISKRLVELMGGTIGVASTLGNGSTFWFDVSFDRLAEEQITPKPVDEVTGPRLQGLRLLVVDDNQINLLLAEKALTKEGAEVVLVQNGQEAIDCLKTAPSGFNLVLMDIQMPVMDGMTATRAIRQQLKLESLPVIALTAGVMAEEKQEAMDAGVNDFLPKPMDLDLMAEMINRYCRIPN